MKKIVCLFLVAFMLFSFSYTYFAEDDAVTTPAETYGPSPNFDDINNPSGLKDILDRWEEHDISQGEIPDWSGVGGGASGVSNIALKFYRLAGISPGKYPYYILTYSTAEGQFSHEGCLFIAYSEEPVFSLSEYNGFYSLYTLGLPCIVFQYFQTDYPSSGNSSWKPVGGVNSTLYILSGSSFSIDSHLNPPMLDVYGSNGSRMNGSSFIYKTNINITLPDGSTFGEPDDSGEGYDPDGYGFEKLDPGPEMPSLKDYLEEYGLIGFFLWLYDCFRVMWDNLIKNLGIIMRNIMRLPNVIADMFKKFIKALFIPDLDFLDSLYTDMKSLIYEKIPVVEQIEYLLRSLLNQMTDLSGEVVPPATVIQYGGTEISYDPFSGTSDFISLFKILMTVFIYLRWIFGLTKRIPAIVGNVIDIGSAVK